ncbi:TPA: hypothetical protein PXP51_004211 [Yersinia enterocolitica]|nr:hypothetical protein [Yersinia enterocolitica]
MNALGQYIKQQIEQQDRHEQALRIKFLSKLLKTPSKQFTKSALVLMKSMIVQVQGTTEFTTASGISISHHMIVTVTQKCCCKSIRGNHDEQNKSEISGVTFRNGRRRPIHLRSKRPSNHCYSSGSGIADSFPDAIK